MSDPNETTFQAAAEIVREHARRSTQPNRPLFFHVNVAGSMTPWWGDHNNLASLWEWLEERGETPTDGPVYFMEKPWKWDSEWEAFVADVAVRERER